MQYIPNNFNFKTLSGIVIAYHKPILFIRKLVKEENAELIDSWIKTTDQGLYPIEYSWKKGEHPKRGHFNPGFFIKVGENILVIEIKNDEEVKEPSDEKTKQNIKQQKDTLIY